MDALNGLRHDTLKRVWDALNCLRREELFTLVLGIERGYLIAEHPSSALIEVFGTMALLQLQGSVVVCPRADFTKIVVLVEDAKLLPECVQVLSESGAWIRAIRSECAFISAAIESERAEGVARLLVRVLGSRSKLGQWDSDGEFFAGGAC